MISATVPIAANSCCVAGHEQDALLVAGVDRQRQGHARKDDDVVQRDQEKTAHRVFAFTRCLLRISTAYHLSRRKDHRSQWLRLRLSVRSGVGSPCRRARDGQRPGGVGPAVRAVSGLPSGPCRACRPGRVGPAVRAGSGLPSGPCRACRPGRVGPAVRAVSGLPSGPSRACRPGRLGPAVRAASGRRQVGVRPARRRLAGVRGPCDDRTVSQSADDRAHDVLAAEAFIVPAGDPSLRREAPHDVLVADEFAMGTRDPALSHAPVQLPAEPYPTAEAPRCPRRRGVRDARRTGGDRGWNERDGRDDRRRRRPRVRPGPAPRRGAPSPASPRCSCAAAFAADRQVVTEPAHVGLVL